MSDTYTERFYAIGNVVQRRTYRVAHEWQPWMGRDAKDAMPVSVLASMADHTEERDEREAARMAEFYNVQASRRGTLQSGKIVCP